LPGRWPHAILVGVRLLLLLVALSSLAQADRAHDRMRYTDAMVEQLRRTGECGRKPAPWWCRAARWDEGTDDPLPLGKPLIGRWFVKGQPGLQARSSRKIELRDDLVACIITGTREHPLIKLEILDTVGPDLLGGVTRVLEGTSPRTTLGTRLATRLSALIGEFPVVAVDGEWYWDERSDDLRLRHVDGFWIAILSPPPAAARAYPDARHVYIFTSAWD
jgi:hypothetical protein